MTRSKTSLINRNSQLIFVLLEAKSKKYCIFSFPYLFGSTYIWAWYKCYVCLKSSKWRLPSTNFYVFLPIRWTLGLLRVDSWVDSIRTVSCLSGKLIHTKKTFKSWLNHEFNWINSWEKHLSHALLLLIELSWMQHYSNRRIAIQMDFHVSTNSVKLISNVLVRSAQSWFLSRIISVGFSLSHE